MNAITVPLPSHENHVRAFPITLPGSVAFIPTHGVSEVVMKSHASMTPFSVETFTGTRPASPTITGFHFPSASPSIIPGFVETIPSARASYA